MAKKNKKAVIFAEAKYHPKYKIGMHSTSIPDELKKINNEYSIINKKASNAYFKQQSSNKKLLEYLKGYIHPAVYSVVRHVNGNIVVDGNRDIPESSRMLRPSDIAGLKGTKRYEQFVKDHDDYSKLEKRRSELRDMFNNSEFNTPHRDSTFIKEGNKLKQFYNNNDIDANVIPLYGEADTSKVHNANINNNDDVALFGHSGSKLAGIKNKWWNKTIYKYNPNNCLLGSCSGDNLKDDFKDVKNLHRTNSNAWYGVNPKADDLENAMYSTRIANRNAPATINVKEGKSPYSIDSPREFKNGGNVTNNNINMATKRKTRARKAKRNTITPFTPTPKNELMLGGILTAATTAASVYSNAKSAQDEVDIAKNNNELKEGQRREADARYLEQYDSSGSSNVGYYKNGGKNFQFNARTNGNIAKFKPLGNGVYEAKGASHENGGIKMGDSEIEGDELVKMDANGMRVLSDNEDYFGYSPAENAKANPNAFDVEYNKQEAIKDPTKVKINKLGKGGTVATPGEEDAETDDATKGEAYGGNYSMIPSLIDNAANLVNTLTTPKVPTPIMEPEAKINTEYNINPSINRVKSNELATGQYIDNNISDANTAAAARIKTGNAATSQTNQLYADKFNKEAELERNQTAMNVPITARNTSAANDYFSTKLQRQLGMRESLTENADNLSRDFIDMGDKKRFDARDKHRAAIDVMNDDRGVLTEQYKSGNYDYLLKDPNFNPDTIPNTKARQAAYARMAELGMKR